MTSAFCDVIDMPGFQSYEYASSSTAHVPCRLVTVLEIEHVSVR